MNISENCLNLIEHWESLKLEAYLDPAGVPTIGYGTIRYPNGQKVKLGDTITDAEAEVFLASDVGEVVNSLNNILKNVVLNQNQFDAIVSLCYNIGVGAFQGSTVLKELIAGDYSAAAKAFELWNKGTVDGVKVVLAGLVNRRRDERNLFEKAGLEGTPISTQESEQNKVDHLIGYREGSDNVLVAMAGNNVVEILDLKSSLKEDLITTLQQYKNALSFEIASPGDQIPAGPRIQVVGKSSDIVSTAIPQLDRSLLILGVRDDEPGISGSDVKQLQERLQELGYYHRDIDGIFGKATDAAVRDFQADNMGVAQADGKVGPKTWAKLWGTVQVQTPPAGPVVAGSNYLLLTKTATKETSGLFRLKLEFFEDGQSNDSIFVVSGQPNHQKFRTGADSMPKSFEPIPEGKWYMHDIEWAGGKDVYDGKVWSSGLGPVKIRLDFVPPNGTRRENVEIHIDWNRQTLPGTAGCIGLNSASDFKRLVTWLRARDFRDLYVDWGLGTVTI
jgi:lysozyme